MEVKQKTLEEALATLDVHYAVDPEFNKSHPLLPYRTYGAVGGINVLMSPSLYDPTNRDAELENVIAYKMAIFAIAFVALFSTWWAVESDRRESRQRGAMPETPPAYMYPSEDAATDEFLEPRFVPTVKVEE